MVDGLIVSNSSILGVLEAKKDGDGMWQLLAGVLKVWSLTRIYPVGMYA